MSFFIFKTQFNDTGFWSLIQVYSLGSFPLLVATISRGDLMWNFAASVSPTILEPRFTLDLGDFSNAFIQCDCSCTYSHTIDQPSGYQPSRSTSWATATQDGTKMEPRWPWCMRPQRVLLKSTIKIREQPQAWGTGFNRPGTQAPQTLGRPDTWPSSMHLDIAVTVLSVRIQPSSGYHSDAGLETWTLM